MSQSVIGALRVNLGLDSAQFERGARRVQSPLKQMRQQFLAVAAVAASFGAAIAASASRGAREIDATAKAARRIGASVAGYRALEMAADDAGVSLSSLANDVQTMNRELARAELGEGNAGAALDRLGLAAADFAGLDADERIAVLADRVKELGLDSGETTLLLRDLGVRNREMALLVLQGGDALRRARQDVNEFGLALSDVDAARIEAANDEIAGLADVATLFRDRIALQVVPALGEMAKAITDSLREGGTLRAVIEGLTGNMDRLAAILGVAVAGFGTRLVAAMVVARIATFSVAGAMIALRTAIIRTGIGVVIVAVGFLVSELGRLVTATGSWGNALTLLGEVASGVWEGIKTSATSIVPALGAVWDQVRSGFISMLALLQTKWADFLRNVAQELRVTPGFTEIGEELFGASIVARSNAYQSEIEAAAAAITADEKRAEAQRRLKAGFEAAADAYRRLAAAVKAGTEDTEEGQEAATAYAEALEEVNNAAGGASGKIRDALTPAIEKAAITGEALSDQMASTFSSIVRGADSAADAVGRLLDRLADQLLQQAFGNLFGNFFGGISIGNNATGTNNWRGGLSWVGERGPELVNLPRGAQVIDANRSARMAMGGGVSSAVNISIDARGAQEGVAAQINAELTRRLPEIQRVAVASVANAGRRGAI